VSLEAADKAVAKVFSIETSMGGSSEVLNKTGIEDGGMAWCV